MHMKRRPGKLAWLRKRSSARTNTVAKPCREWSWKQSWRYANAMYTLYRHLSPDDKSWEATWCDSTLSLRVAIWEGLHKIYQHFTANGVTASVPFPRNLERILRLLSSPQESHGGPIRCIRFNQADPECGNLFATTGGNQVNPLCRPREATRVWSPDNVTPKAVKSHFCYLCPDPRSCGAFVMR